MTTCLTAGAPDPSEMKRRIALARSVLNWWADDPDPVQAFEYAVDALHGTGLSELVDRRRRAQDGENEMLF